MTSAAAPATCGVAMLVPSRFVYVLGGHDEGTLTPGADASGFMFDAPGLMLGRPSTGPRLEKLASASFESVAPTVNDPSNTAGASVIVLQLGPSFAAAAAKKMPPAMMLRIAPMISLPVAQPSPGVHVHELLITSGARSGFGFWSLRSV